jgi:hypothetical protein
MGADYFLAFYGIKVALDPDDEIEQEACGLGTDPRCIRAKSAGLQTHAGRMTEGEDYFLYICRRLASIGVEADPHTAHSIAGVVAIAHDTAQRLKDAGFTEQPAMHLQLEAQY